MSEFSQDYLLYLLAQASHASSAQFHAQLAKQGILVGEWRVLASLHPNLSLTAGELAKECLAQPSTLSRTLDRLTSGGMLVREYSAIDRRQVRVCLTGKGKRLAQSLVEQAREHESQFLAAYSEVEIQDLKCKLGELINRAKTNNGNNC